MRLSEFGELAIRSYTSTRIRSGDAREADPTVIGSFLVARVYRIDYYEAVLPRRMSFVR